MNMLPRGFNKDGKGSRTSSKYFGEAPLSGRTINENYYQDPTPKSNYISREFTQGIFTNELNKKSAIPQRKQIQKDLPIQLQQEPQPDYKNNLKVWSSKKQYEFPRQSRDEYSISQQSNFDCYGFNQKQREQLKNQINFVRQQIEISMIDIVKKMMNEQTSKVRESISDLITQTNNGFKKKQQTLYLLKTQTYGLKEEITKLTKSYQNFYQESEEKFQNLHVELSNLGGVKRSKAGDYNMDLKNSYAGLNSSLSVNTGNQNPNSKLVNQVIFQLDTMKKELSENKMQIQELSFELNSKMLELRNDTKDKNTPSNDVVSMKFEQITKLVREMLKQDKKNNKLQQRMGRVETEMLNLDFIVKSQQQNIQRINNEVANQVNLQINPKIKKIEASLVELFARIQNTQIQKLIKLRLNEDLNQRMKDIRTIRVRNCSKEQQTKLSVLTGLNQDKISYKETYLLDQENYLLDSQGNYLVEQVDGRRERVKIQNEHLYLLQLKGIEISSAT